jgi:ADP-ribose pyrophosphatase YjhB (NUDIX family)
VAYRQACAGAIVHDGGARILLIRRGRPPSAGLWSIPGGKCAPGETPAAACVREVAEETGLVVAIVRFAGRVEREGLDGDVFVIDDFVCRVVGGEVQAGDDAADARWLTRAELAALPLVPGLAEALTEWSALPL